MYIHLDLYSVDKITVLRFLSTKNIGNSVKHTLWDYQYELYKTVVSMFVYTYSIYALPF